MLEHGHTLSYYSIEREAVLRQFTAYLYQLYLHPPALCPSGVLLLLRGCNLQGGLCTSGIFLGGSGPSLGLSSSRYEEEPGVE